MTKLKAVMMLEVLGKPPEYVEEILNKIVEEIGKQQDVKITNKKIAPSKELKDNPNLFTSFAEVELETDIIRLMSLIYNFMPSHVEIITPEELRLNNNDANLFLNELITRLHRYDEIAKSVLLEKQMLANKLKAGQLKPADVELLPGKLQKKAKNKVKRKKK